MKEENKKEASAEKESSKKPADGLKTVDESISKISSMQQGPTVALVLGIIGFIFSLVYVKFLLVLAMFCLIPGIVVGIFSLKAGKKAVSIVAIILSILGLIMAVYHFAPNSGSSGDNSKMTEKKSKLSNIFSDSSLGYSIGYPKDWKQENVDKFSVMFQAPNNEARVFVQNISFKKNGGKYGSLDEGIKDLKKQIREIDKNVKYTDAQMSSFISADGKTFPIKGFDAEYSINGQKVKQSISLVQYDEGGVFFQFGFGSSADKFDSFSALALEMFGSWKIGK